VVCLSFFAVFYPKSMIREKGGEQGRFYSLTKIVPLSMYEIEQGNLA
jgi:hypothetical protein